MPRERYRYKINRIGKYHVANEYCHISIRRRHTGRCDVCGSQITPGEGYLAMNSGTYCLACAHFTEF